MKKSLAIGSFLGVVLTVSAGYYFYGSSVLNLSTRVSDSGNSTAANSASGEPSGLPLAIEFENFITEFDGSTDLLKHRANLRPSSTTENWDKFTNPETMPAVRTTSECAISDLTQSISVPSFYAEAVSRGEINVQFFGRSTPRCFGVQSTIYLLVDDLLSSKSFYTILGEAKIQRLFESNTGFGMLNGFIQSMNIQLEDLSFLFNPLQAPSYGSNMGSVAVLYEISNREPILDPTVIPPFVPGVETVKASSLNRYFSNIDTLVKPVFVDARDRTQLSAGPSYPGSVIAPFIASNPVQLKFQMDFPVELLAGAKYDIRAIPQSRETPIVIYGNNSQDPTPLWMIRYLRLQNYRRIYFVEGGLKALNEAKPRI